MSTYEDFRKQICAGIHMGLSGIPWWTTDIGGFHGGNIYDEDFRELLIRWFQLGTFCPVMRMHGCRVPDEQIVNKAGEVREHTGADNEVWSYGEENYKIMVKFIHIRELMRPYTRSLMKEAHEKATGRKVYLPSGASFVHAGTGEIYEGGQWYKVEAAIDTLPIFIREGRQNYLIGKI